MIASKPPIVPKQAVDPNTKKVIITTLLEEYPNIIQARLQYLCELHSISLANI